MSFTKPLQLTDINILETGMWGKIKCLQMFQTIISLIAQALKSGQTLLINSKSV